MAQVQTEAKCDSSLKFFFKAPKNHEINFSYQTIKFKPFKNFDKNLKHES